MKNKKEFQKYKAFIRGLIPHLQYMMFVGLYEINLKYVKEPKDGEILKKDDDNCTTASIRTDHRYYNATITLYPNAFECWKNQTKEDIAEIIVHEMAHIITDPLYKVANDTITNNTVKFIEDIREQATQHIANIVMKFLRDFHPELIGLKRKKK